jgi:hypothetical protein
VLDHQLRRLRKRQVIDAFASGQKQGAYWSVRSHIESYQLPDPLPVSASRAEELSHVPTRCAGLEPVKQEQLINWGYAICDAAMRKHMAGVRRLWHKRRNSDPRVLRQSVVIWLARYDRQRARMKPQIIPMTVGRIGVIDLPHIIVVIECDRAPICEAFVAQHCLDPGPLFGGWGPVCECLSG